MNERTSAEQTPAEKKEALKTNRAQQTCITLFVVFVISLFAFGKTPYASYADRSGGRVDFISCLGIAMGLFAAIFLLTSFRPILRLSTANKVLGLVGSAGLIAHTVLALFVPLSYGSPAPAGTGGNPVISGRGAEEWTIADKKYKVSSTYYLDLPQGLQYTIEYPHDFRVAISKMNRDRAIAIAFPLIRHAYARELYKRDSVTKLGEGKRSVSRIGVALVEKKNGKTQGYRVALTLDQIRQRISGESAAPETSPSTPASESGQ